MEVIFNIIKEYGLPGFLLVVLILIVQDPERAVKLQAIIIKPFFNLFKWGSKRYIASEVSYSTTSYIQNHLSLLVPSMSKPRIRIKWVSSPEDPVFQADGTLLIRLKETKDQTRNILAATRVALPRVVYSSLRPNLDQFVESAIDLTIIKNLCDRIGKHSYPVFQKHFLGPEIEEDYRASDLFSKLIKIDESGIFVSILLEELNIYGDYYFSTGDRTNKTIEIIQLIEFLLKVASRELGEEVELDHSNDNLRIGIILLAKTWKAESLGLEPYIRRTDINIKLGCESIYIISYPQAKSFLRRLVDALDSDGRIIFIKQNSLLSGISKPFSQKGFSEVVLYRRNRIFDEVKFSDVIEDLGIQEGSVVKGSVVDITNNSALIDAGGVYGAVSLENSSWNYQISCKAVFELNEEYRFSVSKVDYKNEKIEFSRRIVDEDPWATIPLPILGDKFSVYIRFWTDGKLICITEDGFEILLSKEEIGWDLPNEQYIEKLIGSKQEIIIINVDPNGRKILGSIRKVEEDPWILIHEEIKKNSRYEGKIVDMNHNFVIVKLPNGFSGYIPRQFIEEAGFEFEDFKDENSIGDIILVEVSKVFTAKHRIRLNLVLN